MITEEKLKDIIQYMISEKMLDPQRAIVDKQYLFESVKSYLKARQLALETMKAANQPI